MWLRQWSDSKVILMWYPMTIELVQSKLKNLMGSTCVQFYTMIVLFFIFHITKEDHIIKMSSEDMAKSFFIMCLHTYTHSSTHWDYDSIRVLCVCVCARFPIILQTLHLIEHLIEKWRTEVTIIISLSLFFSSSLFFDHDHITQVI